mmetsp:Transcript_796/g.2129  ORF Transcript_796/g.2129 Transcript_796/m.2129 type:complete len:362 (-) Transcript_796:438-1523(-)
MFPNVTSCKSAFIVGPWVWIALHKLLSVLAPPIAVVNLVRLTFSLYNSPRVLCLVLLASLVRGLLTTAATTFLLLGLLLLLRRRRWRWRTCRAERLVPVVGIKGAALGIFHVGKGVVLRVAVHVAILVSFHTLVTLLWWRGKQPGVGLHSAWLLWLHEVRVCQPRRWRELAHESRQQNRGVQLVCWGRERTKRVGQERWSSAQGGQSLEYPLLLRLEWRLPQLVKQVPVRAASDSVRFPWRRRHRPVEVDFARRHRVLEVALAIWVPCRVVNRVGWIVVHRWWSRVIVLRRAVRGRPLLLLLLLLFALHQPLLRGEHLLLHEHLGRHPPQLLLPVRIRALVPERTHPLPPLVAEPRLEKHV